ncbi:MAG: ACP S-malonyltransferase, partial [Anaerolineae bacterium]
MTRTAYLFPGQGSQAVGMGLALAQRYPPARATFAEADAILGFDLARLCFEGPADTLTDTRNAQPAILTTSIAALRILQQERPDLPPPAYVAGHSLGEYSALVAARHSTLLPPFWPRWVMSPRCVTKRMFRFARLATT